MKRVISLILCMKLGHHDCSKVKRKMYFSRTIKSYSSRRLALDHQASTKVRRRIQMQPFCALLYTKIHAYDDNQIENHDLSVEADRLLRRVSPLSLRFFLWFTAVLEDEGDLFYSVLESNDDF